jgi:hypothetical protein
MWTPSNRLVGGVTVLGALCSVFVTLPTRWFGRRPTDSYVFDPPRFSALWIERTVVPVVAVAAAVLTLVGLLALFRRDRERMARWQRWFAVVAVVGVAVGTLATMLLVSVGPQGVADPTAALNVLLGAGLALLAVLLVVPGLAAWGIGYLRVARRRLGVALTAGPVLSTLVVVVNVGVGVSFGLGGLPIVLPFALAVGTVGYDLWARAGDGGEESRPAAT